MHQVVCPNCGKPYLATPCDRAVCFHCGSKILIPIKPTTLEHAMDIVLIKLSASLTAEIGGALNTITTGIEKQQNALIATYEFFETIGHIHSEDCQTNPETGYVECDAGCPEQGRVEVMALIKKALTP